MLIRRHHVAAMLALVAISIPAASRAQSTTSSTTTTTSSTTSTSLTCAVDATFESILCREDSLTGAILTSRDVKRENFRTLLERQTALLKKRTLKSQEKSLAGNRRAAKSWAKSADRVLITIQFRLRSPSGKRSLGATERAALLAMTTELRTSLATLRSTL
jgi:hypothetical protein